MILKYKLGGHGPYTTWDDSPDSEPTTTKSKGSDDDGELGIKDIIALVKDANMLPNDSAYAMRLVNDIFTRGSDRYWSPNYVGTMYSRLYQAIQNARHHENKYKKAEQEVINKKGLSEVAITKSGNFIGKDAEGNTQEITFE
jgi:hypothetical protein